MASVHRDRSRRKSAHPIASYAPGADITAGSRRGQYSKCGGCAEHPPSTCSACGGSAAFAIVDPDFPHAVSLCRRCMRVLAQARAECRADHFTEQAREKMAQAARDRYAEPASTPTDTPLTIDPAGYVPVTQSALPFTMEIA